MSLVLRVDTSHPTPPFEQVRAQLADLIGGGILPDGTRLPPVRQLAADLGLAPGTVARAYRELETAGLVVSRRGAGTRVRSGPRAESHRALTDQAAAFVAAARRLGADDEAVRTALDRAIQAGADWVPAAG